MITQQETTDQDEFNAPKITPTLNVLTILTIIGCSVFALISVATPWFMDFSSRMMTKAAESPDLTPEKMAELRKAKESLDVMQTNIVPLMIISIVGLIACFIGAIMMRKLKKDGYWIYIAGQVIPLVGGLIIAGTSQYQGATSFIFPVITLVFIILYTRQRKYLVY